MVASPSIQSRLRAQHVLAKLSDEKVDWPRMCAEWVVEGSAEDAGSSYILDPLTDHAARFYFRLVHVRTGTTLCAAYGILSVLGTRVRLPGGEILEAEDAQDYLAERHCAARRVARGPRREPAPPAPTPPASPASPPAPRVVPTLDTPAFDTRVLDRPAPPPRPGPVFTPPQKMSAGQLAESTSDPQAVLVSLLVTLIQYMPWKTGMLRGFLSDVGQWQGLSPKQALTVRNMLYEQQIPFEPCDILVSETSLHLCVEMALVDFMRLDELLTPAQRSRVQAKKWTPKT